MRGYLLYRKDEETSLVLTCENDDELLYLLRKMERTRVKWLKAFAQGLLTDFFSKAYGPELWPEAKEITTTKPQSSKKRKEKNNE